MISRKMCQRLSRECSLRTTRGLAKTLNSGVEFLMTPTMSQPNMKEVNMTMKFKLRFQKLKTNSPRRRRTSSTYSRTRCTKRINLLKVRLRIPRKIPRIHKPMKKNLTLSN